MILNWKKRGAPKIENDILMFIRNKNIYAELKNYPFTSANRKVTRKQTNE